MASFSRSFLPGKLRRYGRLHGLERGDSFGLAGIGAEGGAGRLGVGAGGGPAVLTSLMIWTKSVTLPLRETTAGESVRVRGGFGDGDGFADTVELARIGGAGSVSSTIKIS